ncbi:MAG: phospholipid carrier-dependent glycosyltransferase, partial [Sedimentisphaerales bacterium]|nr:phospholipid carrier-dependent glycosyltransferase [Sedimentisphaerales bacterium]
MKWTKKWSVLILFVGVAAALIRLPGLEHRPMHGDEAVHAIKFGELLEKGEYLYDREEYHGPTLNYFTLIPSWLSGEEKLAEVNEFTLRIVPVFFGVGLILLLLLAVDGLGPVASVFAGVLTAFSPAMVFYSRYYIAEMLLVFFTFGVIVCGYR